MKTSCLLLQITAAGFLAVSCAWPLRLPGGEPPGSRGGQAYPAPVESFEKTHRVVFNKPDFLVNQVYEKLDRAEESPDWNQISREANRKAAALPNIQMPMRIFADVYVIASSDSSRRIYVVDCGDDFLLIDAGDHRPREEQLASLRHLGFRTQVPKWVFISHCHFDHSLNSRLFQQMGSEIMIHQADAHALANVNQRTIPYNPVLRGVEFPPCKPDRLLDDGDVLRLGNKTFYVYHTPGHTAGSTCLVLQHEGKNLLFSGDVAFFNGRLGFMGYPYNSFRQYLDSVEKLLRLRVRGMPIEVDALLPGHGTLVLAGGAEHLRRLHRNVKWVLQQRAEGNDVLNVPYLGWDHAWKEYRKSPQ